MKTGYSLMMVVVMVALVMGCRSRADEKRIADLESRLAQIENKNAPQTATPANPTATAAPEEKPEGPLPLAEFDKTDHDFGTVTEGQKVSYDYKFKNNGQAPLIIQTAQPSCGCTVPTWPKEPVMKGQSAVIKVHYDTKRTGAFTKTVTIESNARSNPKVITIKGVVEAPDENADQAMPFKKVQDGATPLAK